MTAELFSPPSRALSANASPYAGAKWYFYQTGTLTPQSVYSDAPLVTPLSNPVVADSGGKFPPIYFNSALSYRGICKDSTGAVTLHDIDPINSGVLSVLAGVAGASSVGFLQTGSGSVSRTVADKLGDVVHAKDFGASGSYSQDATTYLQAAINACPDGGEVVLDDGFYGGTGGDYKITSTLVITRNVRLRGQMSRIVGVFSNNTTDLIRVQPTAELRGWRCSGLILNFNSGGRHAINMGNNGVGLLDCVIENCGITGGAGGFGIKMEGIGTHFNTVRNCFISGTAFSENATTKLPQAGGIWLCCADGNQIYDNDILGQGCGVVLDLVTGAYKTSIHGNGITSRDNGIFIHRGQKAMIRDNTFEQGQGNPSTNVNQGTYKSHLVAFGNAYSTATFTASITGSTMTVTAVASGTIQPDSQVYDSLGNISPHIVIIPGGTGAGATGTYFLSGSVAAPVSSQTFSSISEPTQAIKVLNNNFGGGTNCTSAITLVGYTREYVFEGNDFNDLGSSGADIVVNNATNEYHRYGSLNFAGGARGVSPRGSANTLDPKKLLIIVDNGVGSYGYLARKNATSLTLTNGWSASSDFAYWKDFDDTVHFEGCLYHGTNAATTAVGTFPLGFRPSAVAPSNNIVWTGVNDVTGGTTAVIVTRFFVSTTGAVTILAAEVSGAGTGPASATRSFMDPFLAKGRDSYFSTPY